MREWIGPLLVIAIFVALFGGWMVSLIEEENRDRACIELGYVEHIGWVGRHLCLGVADGEVRVLEMQEDR